MFWAFHLSEYLKVHIFFRYSVLRKYFAKEMLSDVSEGGGGGSRLRRVNSRGHLNHS